MYILSLSNYAYKLVCTSIESTSSGKVVHIKIAIPNPETVYPMMESQILGSLPKSPVLKIMPIANILYPIYVTARLESICFFIIIAEKGVPKTKPNEAITYINEDIDSLIL